MRDLRATLRHLAWRLSLRPGQPVSVRLPHGITWSGRLLSRHLGVCRVAISDHMQVTCRHDQLEKPAHDRA